MTDIVVGLIVAGGLCFPKTTMAIFIAWYEAGRKQYEEHFSDDG